MIKTSIRHATECGQTIYVNPDLRTRGDAIDNLEAFTTERCVSECPCRPNWKPLDLNTQINDCFGWVEMPRGKVLAALSDASKEPNQFPEDLDESQSCFAIVFSFVPEEELDAEVVQQQLDFFHLAGFNLVPFRDNNCRGKGILVHFSDLVPPHCQRWRQEDYQKMSVGWYFVELQGWYVQEERTLIFRANIL
jgi:hypothetical protein